MGCSAGKPLSTSPEISTSTQLTHLPPGTAKHENGLSNNGLVDVQLSKNGSKPSFNSGYRSNSTESTRSVKAVDNAEIPKAPASSPTQQKSKQGLDQTQPKDKENGSLPKIPISAKTNKSSEDFKNATFSQIKVQLTRSQADFFTMLDRKIEAGEDYRSDCER